MEKLNSKIFPLHKSKKSNSIIKGIEEYQSCFDIIKMENETNEYIHKIAENLFNIYDKIVSATNEYTNKIDQIYENLKPNENSYEGRIEKIMYNILSNISKSLKIIFNKIHYIKNGFNSEEIDGLNKKKKDLVEELLQKIHKFKQQRNLYIEEIKNYEIYLVKKELGLIETNERKDDIIIEKENKNKRNNKESFIFDNHKKVYEQQSQYINYKEDLKNFIKIFLTSLNSERKVLYNSIHSNSSDWINFIYTELSNLNEFFKEEIKLINKNKISIICNYIDEDNILNQIFEDDFYTFKFVLINKNNKNKDYNNKIEDNSKIKKKKKDKEKDKTKKNNEIDNLYENIDDNNILSMIKEVEKNQLFLSQKTKDKMSLITNKKYIESIIDLIIKEPEKYDEDTKNKYIELLESNEEYQKALMQYLNNYRGNGRTGLDKLSIIIFSDLFKLVLDNAFKNNHYELVNFIIALSLTYYHLKEDEIPKNKINDNNDNIDNKDNDENNGNNINGNNKIYISEYLKKDQVFKDSYFWEKYLDELIKIEIEKLKKIKDISNITEKQNMNIICMSIYTLSQNMLDYDLEHQFIISIFGKIVEKYNIDDNNRMNISNYLTSKMFN